MRPAGRSVGRPVGRSVGLVGLSGSVKDFRFMFILTCQAFLIPTQHITMFGGSQEMLICFHRFVKNKYIAIMYV